MTTRQLLTNCDSAELTLWQAFFKAEAEEREYQQEQAQKTAALQRSIGGSE